MQYCQWTVLDAFVRIANSGDCQVWQAITIAYSTPRHCQMELSKYGTFRSRVMSITDNPVPNL